MGWHEGASCVGLPPEHMIRGSWRRMPHAMYGTAACLDRSGARGLPAAFEPHNCSLPPVRLSAMRDLKLMLIGDSLMQYQFASLVAWFGRAGVPLRCKPAVQPTLTQGSGRLAAAVNELAQQDPYEGGPQDCERPGLTLYSRRLNLLPLDRREIRRFFDALFAPLLRRSDSGDSRPAGRSVVLLNVGLWYDGPLSRHAALAAATAGDDSGGSGGSNGVSSSQRQRVLDGALALLPRSVGTLARLACERRSWPRILWREHLPQHFPGGGRYSAELRRTAAGNVSSAAAHRRQLLRQRCRPLSRRDARLMHERLSQPTLAAIAAASSPPHQARNRHQGQPHRCAKPLAVVPAFWPLVPRHMDHDGGRLRASNRRADCTHYLPCSGAMMLLNRLLISALAMTTGRGVT